MVAAIVETVFLVVRDKKNNFSSMVWESFRIFACN